MGYFFLSFRDGALAPDLRCAIAHRGISRFRVRCFASPRNDVVWIASSLALLAMTETGSSRHDLIADDAEFDQIHPAKTRGQRHVGGVAAGAHQDAADPRLVVAGVECVPPAGEPDLEP